MKKSIFSIAFLLLFASLRAQVENSFFNPEQIIFPDGAPASVYPSVISVVDLYPFVSSLEIHFPVILIDSNAQGLDLMLESPSGKKVLFSSDLASDSTISLVQSLFISTHATVSPSKIVGGWWLPSNLDTSTDSFPAPGPGRVVQPMPTFVDFLNEDPNGDWKLWAVDDTLDGSAISFGGWWLFLKASPTAVCPFPEFPKVENVTDSSALISWRGNGTASKWDIYLGGPFPWLFPPTLSAWPSDTVRFDTLRSGIGYYISVRSICDDGSKSDWWQTAPFYTPFNACKYARTLLEGHETGCDSLPQAFNAALGSDCGTVAPTRFFRFTPTETREFWIQNNEPFSKFYIIADTFSVCQNDGWACVASSTQASLGVLTAGVPYFLGLEFASSSHVLEIVRCPLATMSAVVLNAFSDSLVFDFGLFDPFTAADSFEVFFGKKPLAPPEPSSLPSTVAFMHPELNLFGLSGLESNTEYEFFLRKRCDANAFSAWQGPYLAKTLPLCARVKNFQVDTTTYSWADLRFRWDVLDSMPSVWRLRTAAAGADPILNFEDDTYFTLRSEQDSVIARIQNIGLWRPLKVWLQAECDAEKQPWQGPFDLPAGKTPPIRIHEIFCGDENSTFPAFDNQGFLPDGIYAYTFNAIAISNPCYNEHHSNAEKLFRYKANKTGSVGLKWHYGGGQIGAGVGFFVKSAATVPGNQGWQYVGCWRVADWPWPPPTVYFDVQKDSTYYLLADAFDWPNTVHGFGFLIDSCEAKCPTVDSFFRKSSTPTSIVLGWNNVAPGGKYVVSHQVDNRPDVEFFETTDTVFEVTGLDPILSHLFGLRAFCADGEAGPQYLNYFNFSKNPSAFFTEANRCNPAFLPPNGSETVGFEATQLEIAADGDYFLWTNQPQFFVYEGEFDPQNPSQNLRAARVGSPNSGSKDTTLFLQAGKKWTLVAASAAFRKAVSKPTQVYFFADGPTKATFGPAFFNKKENVPHGHVTEFPTQKYLRHNLACADSSGWLNLYLANSNDPSINSDLLLLSLKGYDQPDIFNSYLRLTVAGAPGASQITNPPADFLQNQSGWQEMNRYWNISFLNEYVPQIELQPKQPVAVRFYYTDQDFLNLKAEIEASGGQLAAHEDLVFSKISGTHLPQKIAPWFGHPDIPAAATFDATFGFWPFLNGPEATTERWRHGFFAGEHFAEMLVRWFSGGGGGSTANGFLPTDPTVKTTGFDKKRPEFFLFPNPTTGQIRIEWQDFLIEKGNLEIVSSVGQTLRTLAILDGSTGIEAQVADLPEGIYFVKITSRGQLLKALKFVKQ